MLRTIWAESRRADRRIKAARFPATKSLDTFDRSARPLWRWILTATPSPPNLGLEDEGSNYFFFGYSTSPGQLFVSDAGADDYVGLDADQIYPVIVTAADRRGKWDKIEVGVYLDSATPAPSGDGLCP